MSPKVLIITGMHRSGTSLTANYLKECGLYMGENFYSSNISSPISAFDGHHEDLDFLNFHRHVLAKKYISEFPTHSFRLPVKVGKRDRATALELIATRANQPQWGWKDPRTSLFLDFWDGILENARYLFLYRQPLAVVDSLIRRGTGKIANYPLAALKSWRVYNQQILNFWRKRQNDCYLCEIDYFIASPEDVCRDLEKKLGIQLKLNSFERVFSKQGFRTETSDSIENLKTRHIREVSRAIELYQEIQTIFKQEIS
jgi:hypothetical protein